MTEEFFDCNCCKEEIQLNKLSNCKICNSEICDECDILIFEEWLNNCSNKCNRCERIGCQNCISTCYECWNNYKEYEFLCSDCTDLL